MGKPSDTGRKEMPCGEAQGVVAEKLRDRIVGQETKDRKIGAMVLRQTG